MLFPSVIAQRSGMRDNITTHFVYLKDSKIREPSIARQNRRLELRWYCYYLGLQVYEIVPISRDNRNSPGTRLGRRIQLRSVVFSPAQPHL